MATLGALEGTGFIEHVGAVAEDEQGRFWVGQRGQIKLFGSDGRFLKAIGRRGKGPGEFDFPSIVFSDRHGRIHAIDVGNARETIFHGPDSIVLENRIPLGIAGAAPLGETRNVINGAVMTPARIGSVLHVIEGSEIIQSFDQGTPGIAVTPFNSRRILATDSLGRIYSTPYYDFEVSIWRADGELLGQVTGPELNDRPPLSGPWARDNPPPNQVVALMVDGRGWLWVLQWIRRANWKDAVHEVQLPNGSIRYGPKDDRLASVYETKMVVVDAYDSSKVLFAQSFDQLLAGFVSPTKVFELRHRGSGVPQIGLWRLEIADAAAPGRATGRRPPG